MKLRYQFDIRDFAGRKVSFVIGEGMKNFRGYLTMNETGAEIFERLKEEISGQELCRQMAELHPEESADSVSETVKEFTGKLAAAGLLDGC